MLTKIDDELAVDLSDISMVQIFPDNSASIQLRGEQVVSMISVYAAKKIMEKLADLN